MSRAEALRRKSRARKARKKARKPAEPKQQISPLALDIGEFCKAAGNISRDLFYELMRQGLPTIKLGRRRLVLVQDAEAWLQQLREEALAAV
jgi:hypothetical protein